jgi:hypothetical protein
MGTFERIRRRFAAALSPDDVSEESVPLGDEGEEALRTLVQADPNDVEAFARLAHIVYRRAAEGHEQPGDLEQAADHAVWALAEELAHSPRAWYPLVEMARLSIEDDREAAMRRLSTAAERDNSGRALAMGLRMLRETGHPSEALSLGVGHWRPTEHDPEAGRHIVAAAVESGRTSEARRHLEAMAGHPDRGAVHRLTEELDRLIAEAERRRPAREREYERTGEMPRIVVDTGDPKSKPWGWSKR